MAADIIPFFPVKARSPAEFTADVIAHLASRPDFTHAVGEAAAAIDVLEASLQEAFSRPRDIPISDAEKFRLARDIAALRDLVDFWQTKIGEAHRTERQELDLSGPGSRGRKPSR